MRRLIRWSPLRVDDRGASAVEYGLMVAAIAAIIVAVVFGLGGLIRNVFIDTCSEIENNPNRPVTFQDSAEC